MTSDPGRSSNESKVVVQTDRSSAVGLVVAAVVLVLVVLGAIWYFQSTGETGGGGEVTITIDPNADPGTETTIIP